jgi:hypothetical protein
VAGLAAALPLAGRGWGSAREADRVGRRRFGRVGEIELEAVFEVGDSRFKLVDSGLESQSALASFLRKPVPAIARNQERVWHDVEVSTSANSVNPRV